MDEKLKKRIGENVESVWVSLSLNPNLNPNDKYERPKFDAGISISKDGTTSKDDMYEYAWEAVRRQVNDQINKAKARIDLSESRVPDLTSSPAPPRQKAKSNDREATPAQLSMIKSLRKQKGIDDKNYPGTVKDASAEIEKLQNDLEEESKATF